MAVLAVRLGMYIILLTEQNKRNALMKSMSIKYFLTMAAVIQVQSV
jgi:hypothetical protein